MAKLLQIHNFTAIFSMLSFLPRPAHSLDQILLCNLLPTREITRSDLGVNLDFGIEWDEMFREIVAADDLDARLDNRIVFPT